MSAARGHVKWSTIKVFFWTLTIAGCLIYGGLMARKLQGQPDTSAPMAEAAVKDAIAEMEEDIRNRADMQKEIDLFIKITARKEKGAAMQHENTAFNADKNQCSPQQAAGNQNPKPEILKTASSGHLDDEASSMSVRCLASWHIGE